MPYSPPPEEQTTRLRAQSHKSRLHYISSNTQYLFTIVSYLIGVFIFATIVGQVGNVITNRNANRLEFERLLDGAKMYMRHHKVPRDMQRRVLRWYDYSWSRGRIQGGGDINTALGLLPDKLKTELALHVNLSVLKKVTIFQECQPEFLHDLVLKMKAYIFTPGDLICRKGEVAREMFIIADGILEVISETGRVLTTMQAGDFFGEIGILNLDGLNKRTADVRSVGYSELFSLSREDVLAAMKDYPEAQEILQTLGRKRLMEARKASGPATKKTTTIAAAVTEAKRTSPVHAGLIRSQSSHSNKELPDGSTPTGVPVDTNAGKRIVEKLRSDVKGLRNAIRRSRKSNSSKEDSSEPESGKPDEAGSSKARRDSDMKSFPTPRGVLKRMHNVLSDEKDKDPSTSSASTSTPSPAMKIKAGGFASTVKRLQQPKKAAPPIEPEIIGAGLPLIQRLRLLKQKEDRERKQHEEREAMMKTLIPKNLSLASPTVSPILKTKASVETPPVIKTMDPATALANVVERARVERASISSNESGSTISSPPSIHPFLGTFSPKSNLLIGEAAAAAVSKVTSEPIPIIAGVSFPPLWTASPPRGPGSSGDIIPYSAVPAHHLGSDRPSALHFRQQHTSKNYGSVDDLSPEFSRLPFIKKLKILNERQKIAELLMSKSANSVLTRSTSEGSNENPTVPVDFFLDTQLHSLQMGRRTQSNKDQLQIEDEDGASISQYFSQQATPATPLSERLVRVDDRQPGIEPFYMKKGESSTDVKVKTSQSSNTTVCLKEDSSPSLNASTGKSKVRKRRKVKKCRDDGNEGSTEDSSPSPPLSPEGETNETPERRNLKSILKKLAGTGNMEGKDQTAPDDRQLLKSHTVEGYAARHRKFAKNVTFRRQAVTVVSPQGPTPPITASEQSIRVQDEQSAGQSRRDRLNDDGGSTGRPTQAAVLPPSIPLGRPFSPENMKTLSSLLMVKGDEMVLTLGEEERPRFQGLNVAQEECIGSVVLGIKTIIQSKMDEIQFKFQNRFESLEHEVRQRDEIISVLQQRIQELEDRDIESGVGHRLLRNGKGLQVNHIDDGHEVGGDIDFDDDEDMDEDNEFQRNRLLSEVQSSYLFSRGDSIDTVISAQDYDDEVFERAEIEFLEAREALSQQVQPPMAPRNHQNPQHSRRGAGRQNYVTSWAQEQDTIEMRDVGLAPWQLEFHRDRDSLPPPNDNKDAVTVEIGNTSTEYESSSSEDGAIADPLTAGVQLQEQNVSLDDDDSDGLEAEESDSDKSEKSENLNNKNWEVLLLAKEMEKQEEKRRTTEEVVGEMRELENEIAEMKDVVNTGSLSPSELDMLESILESKSKRMKALYKALSVESGSAAVHRQTPASPRPGQSHEDFRRSSGGPTHFHQTLTPAGLGQPTLHPRSALNLGIFSRASSTTERGNKLSPGEKLDLQRLIFSHKGGGVKRQASLCETSESSSSAYLRERRRESAGAIPFPPTERGTRKSSFFSRFSLMRQITSIGRHGTHQSVPESSYETKTQPSPTAILPEVNTLLDSSNLSRQTSSSIGILPMVSSTTSTLSASVKSDPGQPTESSGSVTLSGTTTLVVNTPATTESTLTAPSHSGVFTISPTPFVPATSDGSHASSSSKHLLGEESQPLLKK